MTKIATTITTIDRLKKAQQIIQSLIEKKLIACGQIDEIKSLYYWEDKMQMDKEYRMMLKHPIHLKIELFEELQSLHSYDTPEIISFEVDTTKKYLEWCIESCK